jgi:hypothetical protein
MSGYHRKGSSLFDLSTGKLVGYVDPSGVEHLTSTPDQPLALRVVTDRLRYPYYNIAATQAGGRSYVKFADNVNTIQLLDVNAWGLNETPGSDVEYYTYTIEYPLGNIIGTVTYNGSRTGANPPGGKLISDAFTYAPGFKKGTKAYINKWVGNPTSGINVQAGCDAVIGSNNETITTSSVVGTTLDFTQTGYSPSFALPYKVAPTAVLAYTSCESVGIVGNSRHVAQIAGAANDFITDANGFVGTAERAFGRWGAFLNLSAASDSLANFLTSHGAIRRDLLQYVTQVYVGGPINDLGTGIATMVANLKAVKALPYVVGKRIGAGTMSPFIASTSDFLMSTTGQVAGANDAARLAWRTQALQGLLPVDYVIDEAAGFEQYPGSPFWKVYQNARTVTDGAMTVGSNLLTSATANFTPADHGHKVMVPGAGTAGATLYQRMQYISATQVGLYNLSGAVTQPAILTVSGVTCPIGVWDFSVDGLHEAAPEMAAYQASVQIPSAS